MWIQVANHSTDGSLKECAVINGLEIVLLDSLHDLGEEVCPVPVGVFCGGLLLRQKVTTKGQAQAHHGTDDQNQNCSGFQ